MKKNLLVLLCAVLAIGSCGCKKEDVSSVISDVKESVEAKVSSDDTSDEQYYLSNDTSTGYTIDSEGNEISRYTLDDYKDVFDEIGVDYKYGVSVDGMYDGIIYFNRTDYSGEVSKINYYAIDGTSKKWVNYYSISGDWSASGFEYYKGKVYVDIRTYEDNIRQEEHVFSVDKDSLTFTEEDSEINEILKKTNGKLISPEKYNLCLQRTYDDLGYLIIEESNHDVEDTRWSFVKYTADGQSDVEGLQNVRQSLVGYSKNYLYLSDFDNNEVMLVCYNLQDGSIHKIPREGAGDYYMDYQNGVVYYQSTKEKQYGVYDYSVCRYDCSNDSNEKLYTTSSIPGTGNDRLGIDGFKLIDDRIYVLQFFGNQEKWARFDENSKTFKELDLPVRNIQYLLMEQ